MFRALAVLSLLALRGPFDASPARAAEPMVLDVCPNDYGGFPSDGPPMTCGCAPDALKTGDVMGANPYYYQSSTCRAAVHAGLLGPQGGQILVTPAPVVPVFPGVTRHGIASRSWRGGADNPGFLVAAIPGAAPAGTASAPFKTAAEGMVLDACPNDYGGFPAEGPSLTCGCTPEAMKTGDVLGANPYYYQSSTCRAALHAGLLGLAGGQVVVTSVPLAPVFPAVRRNGVASRSWRGGAGNPGFLLAAGPGAAPAVAGSGAMKTSAEGTVLDVCPSDYGGFPAEGPSLTCGCTPEAIKAGDLMGANPYYYQSSTCRAALHAGVVGPEGGQILLTSVPSAPVFPAVRRNGVASRSWRGGADNPGFLVAAIPGALPAVAGAAPVQASAEGMVLDVCPSDYGSFPADAPSLTCGCTPEALKAGDIMGANPYYYQSSTCRAALHAGVLGPQGGRILLTSVPTAPVFPGVTRNGIVSRSWRGGADNPGFRVAALPDAPAAVPAPVALAAPKPTVDPTGQPIQAPVAETLRKTGQVALYIRFRFNSADLDISGAPTLMQLREALVASPDVRLLLVGHTDAVGGRDYNRSLSLKRAQSVMLWLRDQGIPPERLAIDGKGFDEPAADNDTDSGRALNRRVQAIRIE